MCYTFWMFHDLPLPLTHLFDVPLIYLFGTFFKLWQHTLSNQRFLQDHLWLLLNRLSPLLRNLCDAQNAFLFEAWSPPAPERRDETSTNHTGLIGIWYAGRTWSHLVQHGFSMKCCEAAIRWTLIGLAHAVGHKTHPYRTFDVHEVQGDGS